LQVGKQLIPPGLLATVPDPVTTTLSWGALWMTLNVAVTFWLEDIVTVHVEALPLQPPPDQPVKDEPAPAVAERTT